MVVRIGLGLLIPVYRLLVVELSAGREAYSGRVAATVYQQLVLELPSGVRMRGPDRGASFPSQGMLGSQDERRSRGASLLAVRETERGSPVAPTRTKWDRLRATKVLKGHKYRRSRQSKDRAKAVIKKCNFERLSKFLLHPEEDRRTRQALTITPRPRIAGRA